jgi:hypothetical protein
MLNKAKTKILLSSLLGLLTACGGGGGSNSSGNATPTSSAAILTVNKDGVYQTAPYATSTNLIQNPNSGYFITSNIREEWSGTNLLYTNGYVNPTSGNLNTYSVSNQLTGDFSWGMTNLNYNISLTPPSLDTSQLPFNALAAAIETKIYGGSNNDKTFCLANTSEVDLSTGTDTLVLSQNYSIYQFTKIPGSSTSLYVSRDGHQTLLKNIEYFQFANTIKTMSEILATLP